MDPRAVLQAACDWARSDLRATGVLAGGSLQRGDGPAGGEFDLVVLCPVEPPRRFIRQRFEGVPVDVVPGTAAGLRRELDAEVSAGRPLMAHLLDTGELLFDDAQGTLAHLVALAKARLQRGPGFTPAVLRRNRQLAAGAVQDALDAFNARSPEATRAVHRAVDALAAQCFFERGRFVPRVRQQLSQLRELDPQAAQLLHEVLTLQGLDAGTKLRDAARRLLVAEAFFDWDATVAALQAEQAFVDTQPGGV